MSRNSQLRTAEWHARLQEVRTALVQGTQPEEEEPVICKLFREDILPLLRGYSYESLGGPLDPPKLPPLSPEKRACVVEHFSFLVRLGQTMRLPIFAPERLPKAILLQQWGIHFADPNPPEHTHVSFHPSAETRKHSRGAFSRCLGDHRVSQVRTAQGFSSDDAITSEVRYRWAEYTRRTR